MNTPIDQIKAGDWVIQTEPAQLGERVVGGSPFDLFGSTATKVKNEDRSYMREPFKVVAVELPYVVLESAKPLLSSKWRSTVDTRRYQLRVLSPAFVAAYLATEAAPKPEATA